MHIAGYQGFQPYGKLPYIKSKLTNKETENIYEVNKDNLLIKSDIENNKISSTYLADYGNVSINNYTNNNVNNNKKTHVKIEHNLKYNNIDKLPTNINNNSKNKNIKNPLYEVEYLGNKTKTTSNLENLKQKNKENNNSEENKSLKINNHPIQLNTEEVHKCDIKLKTNNVNNIYQTTYQALSNDVLDNYTNDKKYNNSNNYDNKIKYNNLKNDEKNITEYNFKYGNYGKNPVTELKSFNGKIDKNYNDTLQQGTTKVTNHIPGYTGFLQNSQSLLGNSKTHSSGKNTRNTIIKENILEN